MAEGSRLGQAVLSPTIIRKLSHFFFLIEIILDEFSWNCIFSVHVEKEKEKFAVMRSRRGVHKTPHKIILRCRLRRRPQRQLQKTIGLMKKKKQVCTCTALFSVFLWRPLHDYEKTSWFDVLWRTWTYDDEFSFLHLNLNRILKNSTPGKVACIWHIERVQMDAIKFEKTQIHFLATFLLPPSSSWLLKVPNKMSFRRPAKNLTGHFVHTEPFNIFALFRRNFEKLDV